MMRTMPRKARRPRGLPRRPPPAAKAAQPLTVVGIGASAGGLEAMTRFFRSLRPDLGMAYVVIQHLAPDHESNLPEIIQRVTKMPVRAAETSRFMRPDEVCVIPPNTELSIEEGRMLVSRRQGSPGHSMPIDSFLRSLATDQQRRAVAVILSGSGHDGTLGAKAVKDAGGLVFAQDSESAGQRSMPESAVHTGAVDFVLPPEGIALELARLSRHPYLIHGPRPAGLLPPDERSLRRIFELVKKATGVDFSLYKATTVGRRLQRRLMVHKLDSVEKYVELLEKSPDEVRAFCEETLIHVTHFFREPEAFDAIVKKALPRILKAGPRDAPIRVWVPGCSTGEEAYSLAICLLDALGDRANARSLQVFATDVSEAAIDRARVGVYPEGIRDDVPARLLRRYFTKTERGFQVTKIVRDACVFAKQNLAKDPPFANVDIISCRNVLIYLEPALQRKVLPVFHYALKPSGALLLGSAETVGDFPSLFSAADKKARLYFKKPDGGTAPRMDMGERQVPDAVEKAPRSKAYAGAPPAWAESDVQKAADRLLLSRFAPAGVVIDSELNILQFRGEISRFLKPAPGKASLSLLRMLPDEAHATLHAMIIRAKKSDAAVREDDVALGAPQRGPRVSIEVLPFHGAVSGEKCFLVLFEKARVEPVPKIQSKRAKGLADERAYEKLRKDLSATKEYLQAIIEDHEASNEELKAANEEIISSNEELQSTNEELETAKEELQAANEELTTLNEELHTRNLDLNVVNNDLVNLLASVHMPIVMLSSDLRIRRFTPLAERVMNLIPSDIGRPITDIKLKLDIPELERLIVEVMENVSTRELEVRDRDGRWYSLRIRPYRTTDNKIDGVVLVLVDIDDVKQAMFSLRENTMFAEAVLDMVRDGVVVLDADFQVRSVNAVFGRAVDSGRSAIGRSFFDLAGGRWNVPELRKALDKLAASGHPFSDLKVKNSGGGAVISARRLLDHGRPAVLVLTIAWTPSR